MEGWKRWVQQDGNRVGVGEEQAQASPGQLRWLRVGPEGCTQVSPWFSYQFQGT